MTDRHALRLVHGDELDTPEFASGVPSIQPETSGVAGLSSNGHAAARPRWMRGVLLAAAAYNLLWGGLVIAFPLAAYGWLGIDPPNYPQIWQCVGMIVGVYGIGYWIAAHDPLRHWPIVLVGLLGKILGPIGFLNSAGAGTLPWSLGWMILTNDLVWWLPFGLILVAVYQDWQQERHATVRAQVEALDTARTQYGDRVAVLSRRDPLLLVFLRHTGCVFCREALADIATRRAGIEAGGVRIALVHMDNDDERARLVFANHQLADLPRIADPQRELYRAFGLGRGQLGQLFGWRVLRRGLDALVRGRHSVGALVGDGFQMPGVFLIVNGEVVRSFVHQTAADRPDYSDLAQCPIPTVGKPSFEAARYPRVRG